MEPLRILIADDNPATLQWLVSFLGRQFDIVATAENGRQALASIRCHRPDVVVLDLALPVLNGFEIIRELRAFTPSPAVVICSVETDPEIVEAAREAGAVCYVFKFHVVRDLIAAVRLAVHGQSFTSSL